MRRTVLSLIVGFLAAIACFVLMPIIGLGLLRVFTPGVFDSDTLIWILIFFGPPLLAMLVGVSFIAGLVGFALAKAKLPDRNWRSAQTFVILLTLAATIAVATLIAWPYLVGAIRFWNPFKPNFSVAVARKGVLAPDGILFSKDNSQLAANFTDGLKVFDVVPTR